ncbi:hypothetical protein NE237_026934 [Protea cynaroides]|uniref:Nucleotide-diphospho-sugar transferase domain-containing protein n=1 Tax=Protea cynaroides TaxID=273540 RepID=A0A9Q0JSP8_9MAGN|nr:hypothetical protein NE237_026934 [Protea cynaroides]
MQFSNLAVAVVMFFRVFFLCISSFSVSTNKRIMIVPKDELDIYTIEQSFNGEQDCDNCYTKQSLCGWRKILETEGVNFGGEKLYMSQDFINMMWKRTQFVGEVLKRGYNFIFTMKKRYLLRRFRACFLQHSKPLSTQPRK